MLSKKIRCYELDFGDTNLISEDFQQILNWIETDMKDLKGRKKLYYTISLKFMTPRELKKLPEWS